MDPRIPREKGPRIPSCGPRLLSVFRPMALSAKLLKLRQKTLRCKEAFDAFPIPNEVGRFPIEPYTSADAAGIVVELHRYAVCALRHDREKVAVC